MVQVSIANGPSKHIMCMPFPDITSKAHKTISKKINNRPNK